MKLMIMVDPDLVALVILGLEDSADLVAPDLMALVDRVILVDLVGSFSFFYRKRDGRRY